MIAGVGKKRGRRVRAAAKPRGERHRLMVITIADRLASPHLANLANHLIAAQAESGFKKPEFAEFIGMSGSQFCYVRRRVGNPSIMMLADIARRLRIPLYELLTLATVRTRPVRNWCRTLAL